MKVFSVIREFMRQRKACAPNRKNWALKFAFETEITFDYVMFLPTIVYTPWILRYPNQYAVSIDWLIFHFGFFKWIRKDDV